MRFGNESLSRAATRSLICLALAMLLILCRMPSHYSLPFSLTGSRMRNSRDSWSQKKRVGTRSNLDVTIQPVNRRTLDTVGPVVTGRERNRLRRCMLLLQARRAHQPIRHLRLHYRHPALGSLLCPSLASPGAWISPERQSVSTPTTVPQLDSAEANGLSLIKSKSKK